MKTNDDDGLYDGLTTGSVCLSASLCESILSKQPADRKAKEAIEDRVISPPTQHQQISKSTVYSCCTIKYSTRDGVVSWQIQHSASPRAVFATRPHHPSCCILSYNTRNSALTSIWGHKNKTAIFVKVPVHACMHA